ncbi:MAG: hypothetical protein L6Q99_18140 [Planctomycetes bacterium]|nr:hypothetical protein [Planctomycetota bacterium]
MPAHRRHFRIIRPTLQMRLVLTFIGISAFALLLQYILFVRFAVELVAERAAADGLPLDDIGARLMQVFAISFFLMLPLTFVVGVLATHKFAGPIYRFEQYLKQVIAGEKPADCRLRKGDDLQSLCTLINQATEPLRRKTTAESDAAGSRTGGAEPSATSSAANSAVGAPLPAKPAPERAA